MKFFELSIAGLVIRFYALMAVVIIAGFTGVWPIAILALPIFLSAMLGVSSKAESKEAIVPVTTVIKPIQASAKTSYSAEDEQADQLLAA